MKKSRNLICRANLEATERKANNTGLRARTAPNHQAAPLAAALRIFAKPAILCNEVNLNHLIWLNLRGFGKAKVGHAANPLHMPSELKQGAALARRKR
jgi:hypothetical protein